MPDGSVFLNRKHSGGGSYMIEAEGHVVLLWSDDDRESYAECLCESKWKTAYGDALVVLNEWRRHVVTRRADGTPKPAAEPLPHDGRSGEVPT